MEYGGEFGEDGEKIKKLITKPEINGKELTFNEFQDIIKIRRKCKLKKKIKGIKMI